jgi:hypothetical protein
MATGLPSTDSAERLPVSREGEGIEHVEGSGMARPMLLSGLLKDEVMEGAVLLGCGTLPSSRMSPWPFSQNINLLLRLERFMTHHRTTCVTPDAPRCQPSPHG